MGSSAGSNLYVKEIPVTVMWYAVSCVGKMRHLRHD